MKRVILTSAVAIILLAIGTSYYAGSVLSAPAHHPVGPPPSDLNAIEVEFDDVKGWYVAGRDGAPCVLLMHGVRSDRRSMIERSRILREAGYSSLLFDFQAHGESPGRHITFGYLESANAHAAVRLLRSQFKCTKVAALGQSMGGAAALLGDGGPVKTDLLILESVYPAVDVAIADRLKIRLGSIGAVLSPLLTIQLKPRLGVDPSVLRPISRIGNFHRPVLIMAGTIDRHTPIGESRQLFAAANEPKEFWAVPGAAHVDLQKFAPEAYRNKLLSFLARNL